MTAPQDRAGVVRVMAEGLPRYLQATAHAHAIEQLAFMEAAGLRVVPVKATDSMVECGQMLSPSMTLTECYALTREFWDAMLAASPFAPQGDGT